MTTIPDSIAEPYANLFTGRADVHGTEQGGAYRRGPVGSMSSRRWWIETCRDHLSGAAEPIGSYPMIPLGQEPAWWAAWGCVDYDEGEDESWAHAVNTHNVCQALGAKTWIERSRSKGYHVWLFPEATVPAETMRHALLAAAQIAGAPTREINPKQTTLGWSEAHGDHQLGNYVRLPYPGGSPNGRRCMYDTHQKPYTLTQFVLRASDELVGLATLERIAKLWTPPPPPVVNLPAPSVAAHLPAERRLSGLAWTIYNNGPLNGSDRSETLWKLCREMAVSEVTFNEAESLLREADRRWGKFHSRPDGAAVLHKMLTKAWT